MKTIGSLELSFKSKVEALLIQLKQATQLDWTVTSGRRTMEEQKKLYDQGRTTKGAIVTRAKAGESPHNFGMAADFAPLKNGEPNWPNADHQVWKTLGFIAENMGLTWGGHFKSILDVPHVEDPKWKEFQKLWREGKLKVK